MNSPRSLLLVSALALLGGWIVTSLGLGVWLPRAAGSPLGIALTCGIVAAGGLLLAIAGAALLRAFRGWSRVVILAPCALVFLVATYGLSIAFAAVHPPHPAATTAGPPGAERVEMPASDGVVLSGWYLPSRSGAAVVLRHGAGSTTADVIRQARTLSDAGYGVLATDARGHGDSGGQGMDLGWYGESDITAAVDALIERPDVDPGRIGIVGLSMGGEEALGAAAVDGRIRAVVAEGATGRTAEDKTWLADEYGAAGVLQGVLDTLTYRIIDLLTPVSPPPALLESVRSSSPTPIMLIAAGDRPDEGKVASRLAAVDPARVRVWVVPDAPHVQALRTSPDGWRTRVVGFLDGALRAPERRAVGPPPRPGHERVEVQ